MIQIGKMKLYRGDALKVMRTLPDCSVDSVVTDPPYGLRFMGKAWDYDVPGVDVWRECLRVLKPGGHLLAFAGTRTQHRMAVNIEDAGFEIRDMISWVYGSGFPKSLNVSKALDKAARAEAAKQWQGWGTALKPALEPVTVARKPLVGTVAANVLRWGTSGLNVDGCRVAAGEGRPLILSRSDGARNVYGNGLNGSRSAGVTTQGRWPANLIHDGSGEVVAGFPGSAVRFFNCAKASKRDRGANNNHPTVKPTDLMRYLCRLVTPPGGFVLDPFLGSGSTLVGAALEGFSGIGIERESAYIKIAKARISACRKGRRGK